MTSLPPRSSSIRSTWMTDKNNAIQAANKKDFRRGGVANMTEKADYLVLGGTAIDIRDNFHFVTGMTLVDIDGGNKLVRDDMHRPARVMVMGPAGELYVRNELDDKPAVDYHHMVFEERHSLDIWARRPCSRWRPHGPGSEAATSVRGVSPARARFRLPSDP